MGGYWNLTSILNKSYIIFPLERSNDLHVEKIAFLSYEATNISDKDGLNALQTIVKLYQTFLNTTSLVTASCTGFMLIAVMAAQQISGHSYLGFSLLFYRDAPVHNR